MSTANKHKKEYPPTNLATFRNLHEITQEQAAGDTGLSVSLIRDIERNAKKMTIESALAIYEAYKDKGLTLDYLYCKRDMQAGVAAQVLANMRDYFNFAYDDEMGKPTVEINNIIIEFYEETRAIESFIQNRPALQDNLKGLMVGIIADYNAKIMETRETKQYILIERDAYVPDMEASAIDTALTEYFTEKLVRPDLIAREIKTAKMELGERLVLELDKDKKPTGKLKDADKVVGEYIDTLPKDFIGVEVQTGARVAASSPYVYRPEPELTHDE